MAKKEETKEIKEKPQDAHKKEAPGKEAIPEVKKEKKGRIQKLAPKTGASGRSPKAPVTSTKTSGTRERPGARSDSALRRRLGWDMSKA